MHSSPHMRKRLEMEKLKKDQSPRPGTTPTPEKMPPPKDVKEATVSAKAAGAENHVAPPVADSSDHTTTRLTEQDTSVNPEMPEQTTSANPSPTEPQTAAPASPQDERSETGSMKDEADRESPVAPICSDSAATAIAEEKTQEADAKDPVVPTLSERVATSTVEEKTQEAAIAENPVATASSETAETSAVEEKTWVSGFRERLRAEDGSAYFANFKFRVDRDRAADVRQMVHQGEYVSRVFKERTLPSEQEPYGTTLKLFARTKRALAGKTQLDDRNSALCTFWIFMTWFQEILSFAPCLAISGRAYDGDKVLHTLRAFCRNGFLVRGLKCSAALDRYYYQVMTPTFLFNEPNLSKPMASFLDCTTGRGYYEFKPPYSFDYFGPKAIYLGEDMPIKSTLYNSIHINVSPILGVGSDHEPPLSEELTQSLQNQLFAYRLASLPKVHQSNFKASGLTAETAAIADALGRCIVGAPDLQKELVSLLTPYSDEQIAERKDSLQVLTVEAFLRLCHQGKIEILVREIVGEVNRILNLRGERFELNEEKVGRRLKKAGFSSRHIRNAGMGFVMDRATQIRLHEIARAYGCAGLEDDKENLHCPLCE
jgi:hypothetical protein